jgi:IclR family pca regulon transcriptional regulator
VRAVGGGEWAAGAVMSASDGRGSLSGDRYSSSVDRGLAILRCFTAECPVLGIYEVADRVGFRRSTVHRYVATLHALGYLEQVGRKYRLAPRAGDLGMSVIDSLPVRRHSHAVLERLREQTGYTASLGVLDGREVLYVDRARASRRGQREIDLGVPLGLRVGWRLPVDCSAMGKLLLAHLPEPERRKRVKRLRLARRGPGSITDKTALRRELERIRAEGVAVSNQELAEGLLSIAAPVWDAADVVVAAVSIEAHASMISVEELLGGCGPGLKVAAERLSVSIGEGEAQEDTDDLI